MKFTLKDYQDEAVKDVFINLKKAQKRWREDGDKHAFSLTATTGAGKTVMAAAVFEALFFGDDDYDFEPDPGAVVIWFSDDPSLNEQSRFRLMEAADKLTISDLLNVGNTFSREKFEAGKIYFLNTQKLSKKSLLVRGHDTDDNALETVEGQKIMPDMRSHTIWDTIQNTIEDPDLTLYLVLDEAHRGIRDRVDVEKMKAINLPHFKLKLRDVSRELYLEHGWQMPRGLVNSIERNPLNFTQAEWQQAKRIKQDPRMIKQTFQDCWAISDSKAAFASALEERGYYLAKGDRRGFVAVDWRGEVYAISRWVGVKAKDVKAKLGNPDELSSVEKTRQELAGKFTDKFQQFVDETISSHDKAEQLLKKKCQTLASRNRQERAQLEQMQKNRRQQETLARSSQLPTGLKALWFRVTGKYRAIKNENEANAAQCKTRDQSERQKLIDQQLRQRRQLQHEIRLLRHQHGIRVKKLNRDIGSYLKLSPGHQIDAFNRETIENTDRRRRKRRSRDFT